MRYRVRKEDFLFNSWSLVTDTNTFERTRSENSNECIARLDMEAIAKCNSAAFHNDRVGGDDYTYMYYIYVHVLRMYTYHALCSNYSE